MYKKEELEYKKDVIESELSECELDKNFNCVECCDIDDCYCRAQDLSNHIFADLCNYGGYDTEEEFWESIMD